MIAWEHLDTAPVDGGGQLTLHRRDTEYSIRVNGQELMNSRLHGSEEELARLVCSRIARQREPRVLIGGLGMGYLLAAALDSLGESARFVVAELVPAVVEWNRGVLGHLAGQPLDDPRVHVHVGDVLKLLHGPRSAARYTAVLLDVDNGPQALTRNDNDQLYDPAGLAATRRVLTASGVVGYWSAGPDPRFSARLRRSGLDVEELRVPARSSGRGGRHTLWIGSPKRGDTSPQPKVPLSS